MGFNQSLIIATLMVSLVFIVFSGLIASVSLNYNVVVDDEFNETFNQFAEANQLVTDLDATIEGGDVNPEGQDQAVYKNVIVAGKAARDSSKLANNLLNEAPKIIGIDATVIGILSSLLFVLVLFGFIAMISRRTP